MYFATSHGARTRWQAKPSIASTDSDGICTKARPCMTLTNRRIWNGSRGSGSHLPFLKKILIDLRLSNNPVIPPSALGNSPVGDVMTSVNSVRNECVFRARHGYEVTTPRCSRGLLSKPRRREGSSHASLRSDPRLWYAAPPH